jgi:ribosomal protein L4
MFAPTKTWRKWHRKINVNQKRYAMCSALAGSALPALVMARGHRVENIPEVPLVVANAVESIQKTSHAVKLLKDLKAYDDVERCKNSKKIRAGKVCIPGLVWLFPLAVFREVILECWGAPVNQSHVKKTYFTIATNTL